MKKQSILPILSVIALAAGLLAPNASTAQNTGSQCQHWDKIVFTIKKEELATAAGLTMGQPYDIKVPDLPEEVADLKLKVLEFFDLADTPENRGAIAIKQVGYAIECPPFTS